MTALAFVPVAIWLYLLLGRGMFWLARERDDRRDDPEPAQWPSVAAIVPARNEADVIAGTLSSLLAQDYPGPLRIVLTDDQSTDGTGEIAREIVQKFGGGDRASIVTGTPRPSGWTGKLWAMRQGMERAASEGLPDYFLFTDADILHAPDNLRRLVSHAEAERCVLVSLMAKLYCQSWSEKLLIPAFVFFFDMLFPFHWVNDPSKTMAAAAGGCMLARADALATAGGLETIRGAIIDDCALARIMKTQGSIWLGLTERARSVRPYGGMAEIGGMVQRSAYAQLDYSALALAGTILGMILVYVAAPLFVVFGSGMARIAGIVAWSFMAISYQPMLRFYRLSFSWGLLLPLTAALYTLFTFQSALQFWRGRGGMWKGRAQAIA